MDGYSRTHRSKQRGSVLVSALAFALVISLALAGAAAYTVAHMSQAASEADYASAMNMAEAGANWELRKLALTSATTDTSAAPGTGTVSYPSASGTVTLPGSFSVYVTNSAGTGNWTAPNPALVWSTGTVNGISRTIRVPAYRKSLFNEFAIFGIFDVTSTGNFIIEGNIGSNQTITGSGNSNVVYGDVIFHGNPTGTYAGTLGWVDGGFTPAYGPYGMVRHEPDALPWPTVSEIADRAAAAKSGTTIAPGTGLAWFKANNDNIRADKTGIQVFSATDKNNVTNPTTRGTLQIAASAIQDKTPAKNWILPNGAGNKDENAFDVPGAPKVRYVYQALGGGNVTFPYVNPTNSVTVTAFGLYNKNVVILPGSGTPGVYRDYYFESISMAGTDAVLVDTARGPVRIWLDSPDLVTSDDSLGQFMFTSAITAPVVKTTTDPSLFRLYSNKGVKSGSSGVKGQLILPGNTFFPGGIYAYNGTANCMIGLGGGTVVYGSAISAKFAANGNPLLKFPPATVRNDDPNDWSISWGFLAGATEVSGAN